MICWVCCLSTAFCSPIILVSISVFFEQFFDFCSVVVTIVVVLVVCVCRLAGYLHVA